MNTIDKHFRIMLIKKDIRTKSDFARLCNMEPTNLNKYLQGKIRPEIKNMFLIANALKEPIENIIELFYNPEFVQNCNIVNKSKAERRKNE